MKKTNNTSYYIDKPTRNKQAQHNTQQTRTPQHKSYHHNRLPKLTRYPRTKDGKLQTIYVLTFI